MKKEQDSQPKTGKFNFKGRLAYAVYGLLALIVLSAGFYGYLYVSTPEHIRHPAFDHYHFRTQIIVDGEPVDFSRAEFQEEITSGANTCSIELNGTPIDFHDNEDQMTHIHWGGVTGGEFLKYYGWNLIGGEDDSLGRRYDQGMMSMHHVNIKGNLLPAIPAGANFYVYIGDETGYDQKDWNSFLELDLEDFFGKQSRLSGGEVSFDILDLFTQPVYAHGAVDDGHDEPAGQEADKAKLERINNLIGNVVIFVQADEPSDEQIKARFDNLAPLHESTCGG